MQDSEQLVSGRLARQLLHVDTSGSVPDEEHMVARFHIHVVAHGCRQRQLAF
jgi:hypothetical protein